MFDKRFIMSVLERFKNDEICVNCRTEEDAIAFMKECSEMGLKWQNGEDPVVNTRWKELEDSTLYFYEDGICYGEYAAVESQKLVVWGQLSASSAYWGNICEINRRQEEKGLSKYGQTLEDNTSLMMGQRIDHFEEELIDALKYAEHIKAVLSDTLTANDYQRAAMRTASGMQYDISASKNTALLINGVMGLNGEAGECIDIVKKSIFQGHEIDKDHLIEELGDCAWYIAVSAEALGITLEELLNRNIEKLKKRYPEGFDKSRSVNREAEGK